MRILTAIHRETIDAQYLDMPLHWRAALLDRLAEVAPSERIGAIEPIAFRALLVDLYELAIEECDGNATVAVDELLRRIGGLRALPLYAGVNLTSRIGYPGRRTANQLLSTPDRPVTR